MEMMLYLYGFVEEIEDRIRLRKAFQWREYHPFCRVPLPVLHFVPFIYEHNGMASVGVSKQFLVFTLGGDDGLTPVALQKRVTYIHIHLPEPLNYPRLHRNVDELVYYYVHIGGVRMIKEAIPIRRK